ncbi:MAG: hypothetical protein AB7O45_03440, partial [Alphaproteobacteria bacterium]
MKGSRRHRRGLTRAVALAACLLAVACQTAVVPTNKPIERRADGRPDFASNYGWGTFALDASTGTAPWAQQPGSKPIDSDLLVFLAFSGGGKRSAAFAHGALRGLRQIQVAPAGGRTRDLLAEVNYISSVSGGSFP